MITDVNAPHVGKILMGVSGASGIELLDVAFSGAGKVAVGGLKAYLKSDVVSIVDGTVALLRDAVQLSTLFGLDVNDIELLKQKLIRKKLVVYDATGISDLLKNAANAFVDNTTKVQEMTTMLNDPLVVRYVRLAKEKKIVARNKAPGNTGPGAFAEKIIAEAKKKDRQTPPSDKWIASHIGSDIGGFKFNHYDDDAVHPNLILSTENLWLNASISSPLSAASAPVSAASVFKDIFG